MIPIVELELPRFRGALGTLDLRRHEVHDARARGVDTLVADRELLAEASVRGRDEREGRPHAGSWRCSHRVE